MDKLVVIEQQSLIDIVYDGFCELIVDDQLIDEDIANYFRKKQLFISTKGTDASGDFDGDDFDSNDFNT